MRGLNRSMDDVAMKHSRVRGILAGAICALAVVAMCNQTLADAITPGVGGNTLIAAGPNHLTVFETIVDVGGGMWEYSYSFTSDEPASIWHLFLYTPYTAIGSGTTFPNQFGYNLDAVSAPYDARNLDLTLVHTLSMWYEPLGGGNGVSQGGGASFSFRADVFDANAKLFAYETDVSGHAGTGVGSAGSLGQVAAIGYTTHVPEPGTVSLLTLALVGSVGLNGCRHRRVVVSGS